MTRSSAVGRPVAILPAPAVHSIDRIFPLTLVSENRLSPQTLHTLPFLSPMWAPHPMALECFNPLLTTNGSLDLAKLAEMVGWPTLAYLDRTWGSQIHFTHSSQALTFLDYAYRHTFWVMEQLFGVSRLTRDTSHSRAIVACAPIPENRDHPQFQLARRLAVDLGMFQYCLQIAPGKSIAAWAPHPFLVSSDACIAYGEIPQAVEERCNMLQELAYRAARRRGPSDQQQGMLLPRGQPEEAIRNEDIFRDVLNRSGRRAPHEAVETATAQWLVQPDSRSRITVEKLLSGTEPGEKEIHDRSRVALPEMPTNQARRRVGRLNETSSASQVDSSTARNASEGRAMSSEVLRDLRAQEPSLDTSATTSISSQRPMGGQQGVGSSGTLRFPDSVRQPTGVASPDLAAFRIVAREPIRKTANTVTTAKTVAPNTVLACLQRLGADPQWNSSIKRSPSIINRDPGAIAKGSQSGPDRYLRFAPMSEVPDAAPIEVESDSGDGESPPLSEKARVSRNQSRTARLNESRLGEMDLAGVTEPTQVRQSQEIRSPDVGYSSQNSHRPNWRFAPYLPTENKSRTFLNSASADGEQAVGPRRSQSSLLPAQAMQSSTSESDVIIVEEIRSQHTGLALPRVSAPLIPSSLSDEPRNISAQPIDRGRSGVPRLSQVTQSFASPLIRQQPWSFLGRVDTARLPSSEMNRDMPALPEWHPSRLAVPAVMAKSSRGIVPKELIEIFPGERIPQTDICGDQSDFNVAHVDFERLIGHQCSRITFLGALNRLCTHPNPSKRYVGGAVEVSSIPGHPTHYFLRFDERREIVIIAAREGTNLLRRFALLINPTSDQIRARLCHVEKA